MMQPCLVYLHAHLFGRAQVLPTARAEGAVLPQEPGALPPIRAIKEAAFDDITFLVHTLLGAT